MEPDDQSKSGVSYPAWTDYRKKNGLDPLGMQNSSIGLYQSLLPGISNVTLRMRYYGLYVWLCSVYGSTRPTNQTEDWKRFVRRAEALYALIAYHAGNQSGVAGVKWAGKAHEKTRGDTINFAIAADPGSEPPYLQQAWGAYGAAYASQLFAIGIFWESPNHAIPVPSRSVGDRLARTFAKQLGELADLFLDVRARGVVTRRELNLLVPVLPSEIGPTTDERTVYQELLLAPRSSGDINAMSRRRSLLLVLNVAGLIAHEPNADDVRWILYAGQDQHDRSLEISDPELQAQRRRWWLYHANDLCHVALETLLKCALDTLSSYSDGLPLNQLIRVTVERILGAVDAVPASWGDLLEMTETAANPYSNDNELSEWSLSKLLIDNAGRDNETVCLPETAWKAVLLLVVLHRRVRDEVQSALTELMRFKSEAFQTLLTVVRVLDAHAREPIGRVLIEIVEHRVVRRHLWVAARKFQYGDYTFLIESDDGLVRLREKDGPVFTNPRLGPAITFLKDIHLIDGRGLTRHGQDVLRNL